MVDILSNVKSFWVLLKYADSVFKYRRWFKIERSAIQPENFYTIKVVIPSSTFLYLNLLCWRFASRR